MEQQSFKSKVENFFYYHKYKVLTIGCIVLAIVLSVTIFAPPAPADVQIAYLVNKHSGTPYIPETIQKEFEAYAKDYNGDGKIAVSVTGMFFRAGSDADVSSGGETEDAYQDLQSHKMLQTLLLSGEPFIFVMDETMYAQISQNNAFTDLANVVTVVSSEDGKSFIPEELSAYQEGKRPEYANLRFAIRGLTKSSSDKQEKSYAASCDFLQNIIDKKIVNPASGQ